MTARDLRTVVEELWLAGAEADRRQRRANRPGHGHRRHRRRVLVNSAYLAPPYQVAAIGPADLYDVLAASPGFVELVRRARRAVRHPDLVRPAGLGDRAGVRRLGDSATATPGRPTASPEPVMP